MHIVLANRWYPPKSNGGVAAYNYYLARALVNLGHRVTVITARLSAQEPAHNMEEGVCVHRLFIRQLSYLNRFPLIGKYMRALQQMQYSLQVARHLKMIEASNNPPDIIEFAEVNAEGWAYLRRRQRYPVVVRCHTPTFVLRDYYAATEMPYDTELTTRLEQFCIQHADALTSPSQNMAKTVARYMAISPERFHVIPNPVDVTQFAVEHRMTHEKKEQIVLHVGRLDRIKGIEVLAQAMLLIIPKFPLAHFVFIGGGEPWFSRLIQFVQAHQLTGNVTFLGHVDQESLLSWYKRADVAVVPSLNYESFSYTCAQAMAAGIPVVASAIGGIPETVEDQHQGLLIEPGNVEQLSTAIQELLSDHDKRNKLGFAASEKARKKFDSKIVASQMLQVYHRLRR